jgi:cellulose synthase/poly-beta-1,6-N-acetylglucosamine synthase-like glycosyltransferase
LSKFKIEHLQISGKDMLTAIYFIVYGLQMFILGFLFTYNTLALIIFIIAVLKIRKYISMGKLSNLDLLYDHPGLPGLSFLVPAYNEENAIISSIESLMNLHYPKYEIIIINDGSTDSTFRKVKNHFNFEKVSMPPTQQLGTEALQGIYEIPKQKLLEKQNITRVVMIDKKNGGKADSLNAGINIAAHNYVCSMDADSMMDRNALLIGMRPFLDDPTVKAVGGQVSIANGCEIKGGEVIKVGLPKKAVELFQIVEYARSFNIGRTGLAAMNSLVVLSGVFSIFKKDLILKIGGYLTHNMKTEVGLRYCGAQDTVCEDMEIVVRLYRYMSENKINGRVEYLPFPLAWTEAPDEYISLGKQRNRWFRGLFESLWFHKKMLFNPFLGKAGLFAMPYQFIFEFLGPMIELFGYASLPVFFALGYVHKTYFILFLLLAVVYGMFLSVGTLLIGVWLAKKYKTEHENYNIFFSKGLKSILLLIFFALLSNLGYRQYLLFWQAKGFIDVLKGKKSWEKFEHKGFGA